MTKYLKRATVSNNSALRNPDHLPPLGRPVEKTCNEKMNKQMSGQTDERE